MVNESISLTELETSHDSRVKHIGAYLDFRVHWLVGGGLFRARSSQKIEIRMIRYCVIVSLLLCCLCFTDCAEVSVRGSEYIKFDLLGTNTSIFGTSDTLSLRFKTVEPQGLLFYAHGVGYITLELYHCKLR